MNIRLFAATLMLIAFAPRPSVAGENKAKKAEKEEARLEEKCSKEADKDVRDFERDRRHARPDNKWDELCAPPAPPPVDPPAIEPPALIPPPPPPGMMMPLPPPPPAL